jgi:hypothetical protein
MPVKSFLKKYLLIILVIICVYPVGSVYAAEGLDKWKRAGLLDEKTRAELSDTEQFFAKLYGLPKAHTPEDVTRWIGELLCGVVFCGCADSTPAVLLPPAVRGFRLRLRFAGQVAKRDAGADKLTAGGYNGALFLRRHFYAWIRQAHHKQTYSHIGFYRFDWNDGPSSNRRIKFVFGRRTAI